MSEPVLLRKKAIEKLNVLNEKDGDTYEFERIIAKYFGLSNNKNIYPNEYVNCCAMVLADLFNGYDGYTGKKIKNNMTHREHTFYVKLWMDALKIVRIIASKEFAENAETLMDILDENMMGEQVMH